jgi:hypothetical protein
MKTRNGFVSNSSTTSFIVYGYKEYDFKDKTLFNKIVEGLIEDDSINSREDFEDLVNTVYYHDYLYKVIGLSVIETDLHPECGDMPREDISKEQIKVMDDFAKKNNFPLPKRYSSMYYDG